MHTFSQDICCKEDWKIGKKTYKNPLDPKTAEAFVFLCYFKSEELISNQYFMSTRVLELLHDETTQLSEDDDLEVFRDSYISNGRIQMDGSFMGDLENISFAALVCAGVINDVESPSM